MSAASSNPRLRRRPAPAGSRLHTARAHATPPLLAAQALPRHSPAVGGLTPSPPWTGLARWPPWSSSPAAPGAATTATTRNCRPAPRYDWREVRAFLATRQGLLDAVVFSGGEPLSEPRLPAMIRDARRMGFRIGLHTAGIYPLRLADALRHLDWAGLDIKADAQGYDDITGRRESQRPAQACLTLLLASGVDFECRITWHPDWLDETRLLALARELARRGVRRFAVQNARSSPTAAAASRLGPGAQEMLRGWFDEFACR